ncbi:MAG: hypothetical protein ACK559_09545, partial [bacterium]
VVEEVLPLAGANVPAVPQRLLDVDVREAQRRARDGIVTLVLQLHAVGDRRIDHVPEEVELHAPDLPAVLVDELVILAGDDRGRRRSHRRVGEAVRRDVGVRVADLDLPLDVQPVVPVRAGDEEVPVVSRHRAVGAERG